MPKSSLIEIFIAIRKNAANQTNETNYNMKIRTALSMGGLDPASIKSIFHFSTSLKRLAKTLPAEPPPTIIKSYVEPSGT